jgi:VIT1/CCC1 family predicted Fe2+/Mn2+ transporter
LIGPDETEPGGGSHNRDTGLYILIMPLTPHTEKHFTSGELVRDIVIGMSDGLTVPFALAAGLSSAVGSPHVVVTAGLAEIAAGSIAMGLGGYLAARSDADHFAAERNREQREVAEVPEEEKREVNHILRQFGLSDIESETITEALSKRPKVWVDFMMRFELRLEEPEPGRALRSAFTIALSYVAGGLIPLSPYFGIPSPRQALLVSVGVTLVALAVFGYLKGRASGANPVRGGVQTTVIGALAAAAAFALAKVIS